MPRFPDFPPNPEDWAPSDPREGPPIPNWIKGGGRYYTTLNDAADNPYVDLRFRPYYREGPMEIWYQRNRYDTPSGTDWLANVSFHEIFPTSAQIQQDYVKLGGIWMPPPVNADLMSPKEIDALLETIYRIMQGEEWSPRGEARDLIKAKGLSHTSMMVGDAIHLPPDKWHIVTSVGWCGI